MICFNDRYTEATFSKFGVWHKLPEGSALIFGDTRISFQHSAGWLQGSCRAKNQLDSFIPFDETPTCDKQTDTDRQTDNFHAISLHCSRPVLHAGNVKTGKKNFCLG